MVDRSTPSWVLILVAIIGAAGVILAAIVSQPGKSPIQSSETISAYAVPTRQLSQSCIVPSLERLELNAAEAQLANLGINIVKSNQYSAEITAGLVVSHDPPAGYVLNPCQGEVVVIVSLGPTPVAIPTNTTSQTSDLSQSDIDFSGNWVGFITQNHAPKHWDMSLSVQQNGDSLSGESVKSPENTSVRVGYRLQGSVLGNDKIRITETQQTFVEASGSWRFCTIQIEATLVNSNFFIGQWKCINHSSRSYGHTEFKKQ